jgi:hypothetical protein
LAAILETVASCKNDPECNFHHYKSITHFKNPRYQYSLKLEINEILPILSAAILKMTAILMQFSSLPINSSLQNNPRYKFSLKSENIDILPILSAAI